MPPKQLPIVNRPSAPYHMTSADWLRKLRDYRRIVPGPFDKFRIRQAMRLGEYGAEWAEVYITDRPAVWPPNTD